VTNLHTEFEGTLLASVDDRLVSGLLIPYGEVGNSNLGRFAVTTGAFTLPTDPEVVGANIDHDREHPVGRAVTLREETDGTHIDIRVAKTTEGDALLAGFKDGKRKRLSAEVRDVIIRNGKALGGTLFGAAFVEKGAFPAASLYAKAVEDDTLFAADEGDVAAANISEADYGEPVEVETSTVVDPDTGIRRTTTITEERPITEPAPVELDTNAPKEHTVAIAKAPNTLQAKNAGPQPLSRRQAMTLMAAIASGTLNDPTAVDRLRASGHSKQTLFADLADIKYDSKDSDAGKAQTQAQWIGELWDGLAYRPQFSDLFLSDTLTSLYIEGFRPLVKPEGGTWTGNKSQIPSNEPTWEAYKQKALLFAGGHDIAREHLDFGNTDVIDSYFELMAESYARWVDETVIFAEIEKLVPLAADEATGLQIGTAMSAIIDAATEVIGANAVPSFALVETKLYKQILKTPNDSTLGYLTAGLGLEEGQLSGFQIRPSNLLSDGEVVVGAREAAKVYQLGGGAPIRVEAEDIARGGVDKAIFGYAGIVVNKTDAIVSVIADGTPA
jgi:hypothetical protein